MHFTFLFFHISAWQVIPGKCLLKVLSYLFHTKPKPFSCYFNKADHSQLIHLLCGTYSLSKYDPTGLQISTFPFPLEVSVKTSWVNQIKQTNFDFTLYSIFGGSEVIKEVVDLETVCYYLTLLIQHVQKPGTPEYGNTPEMAGTPF